MNVKNLRVFKEKIVPLAVAGTLALSLVGCGGNVQMKEVDFDSLMTISEVQNATMIDELIANGALMYDDNLNLLQASDQLIRYLDIVAQIGGYDFTGVDSLEPLDQEVLNATLNMTPEEVEGLIEVASYKGDDVVALEAKLNALKKLNFLHNYCQSWVDENGPIISERIMLISVKASVADELELGVDEVSYVHIPERHFAGEPDDYYVNVGKESYRVPMREGEIWNTINYIYEVQGSDFATMDAQQRADTYRKAINYAKTTIAAGSNIKNDKLMAQYDADYIEGNFVK